MTSDEVLVIQTGFFIRRDKIDELVDRFAEMKRKGVVLIDPSMKVLVCPKDVEIRVENPKET